MIIRIEGLHFVSFDMKVCLLPWFHEIQAGGGMSALRHQVGDYGIPYQTLIALLTYLHFNPLLMYKAISIVFDFVLALSVALFVKRFVQGVDTFISLPVLAYGIVLLSPQVVMNSSVWGQCDAIYASFCILAIYFCESKRYAFSSICLGFAFAAKLQAIFLLPYFVYKILQHSHFGRLLYGFIIPLPNIVLSIPALISGRNWTDIFGVFFNQVSTYNQMSLNAPTLWPLLGNVASNDFYTTFHVYAIIMAGIAACMIILFGLLHIKDTPQNNMFIAFLLLFAVIFILPDMHERYIYLVEIAAIIVVFIESRLTPITVAICFVSACSGGVCLFGGNGIPLAILSAISLLALFGSTYFLYRRSDLYKNQAKSDSIA